MGCALILYHGSIKERGFSRRAERQRIYSLAALLAGGVWHDGANCGARAVHCSDYPWNVDTLVGARGACDSL